MRILVYTHEFPPHTGGIATYNAELISGLAERGHDVLVIAPKYRTDSEEDRNDQYRLLRPVSDRSFKLLKLFIFTSSLLINLASFRPNIVMVSDGGSQRVAAILSLFFRFNYVLVIHGKEIRRLFENDRLIIRSLRELILLGFQRAGAVIAVSEASKETVAFFLPELIPNTHVIHIGIAVKEGIVGNREVNELREKLSIDPEDKILLTISRLTLEKGQDFVIEALPRVIQKVPNVKYIIVGDGECEEKLRELTQSIGVGDYVRFVGKVPHHDIWSYYRTCDVFVMPSRRIDENFGIVFLEAAAFSKPVIGGDLGGMVEAVKHGETGILIDPESVEEIAEAIIHLLTHPEEADRMGANGRRIFETRFSKNSMLDMTIDLIKQVANEH